ncbi:hypothetical protein [Helicobacter sp. 13S00477-4]|uniref:hypothetical protein n=1 Tax=Helicobacter sp. 13S00477-4 TaxID=1905759 RepID=UPI000BA6F7B7|nr:hypothetical protein [Helicobacter sp. 13S00477-4]PAF50806.1 hypothetical protein BKH44_06540 [Helicobacter sp. 13S00477-4]
MIITYRVQAEVQKSFKGDEIALKKWAMARLREALEETDIDDPDFEVEYEDYEIMDMGDDHIEKSNDYKTF